MRFFLILLTLFAIPSLSAQTLKTFRVQVDTVTESRDFLIETPTASIALDSIYIAAIYNKKIQKVRGATVHDALLSSYDLPFSDFYIETDRKRYFLSLDITNPEFAMTTIQIVKKFLSRSDTRNVSYLTEHTRLKDFEAHKVLVRLKNAQYNFMLNTPKPELIPYAIKAALIVSGREGDLVEISIPSLNRVRQCTTMFR